MANAFNAPGVVKPFGIFSGAAWQPEGKVLHISGQVSQDVDGKIVGVGDITAQTRQVLGNISKILDGYFFVCKIDSYDFSVKAVHICSFLLIRIPSS